jgi:hypothetical protein
MFFFFSPSFIVILFKSQPGREKSFKRVPHDPKDNLSTINNRERERGSAAGGH